MLFNTLNINRYTHILNQSPWPLVSSISAMILVGGLAMYMHGYKYGFLVSSKKYFGSLDKNNVNFFFFLYVCNKFIF